MTELANKFSKEVGGAFKESDETNTTEKEDAKTNTKSTTNKNT